MSFEVAAAAAEGGANTTLDRASVRHTSRLRTGRRPKIPTIPLY